MMAAALYVLPVPGGPWMQRVLWSRRATRSVMAARSAVPARSGPSSPRESP